MRISFVTLLTLVLASCVVRAQEVKWIWSTEEPAAGQHAWFHHAFRIDEPIASARLAVTCDNSFSLWLNGHATARGDDWTRLVWVDLDRQLESGWNVFAVAGVNTGGPAGLALRLEVELASGQRVWIVTDSSWVATTTEPDEGWRDRRDIEGEWSAARSCGGVEAPQGPWPDPFTPRKATPPEQIEVPDGFQVELLRSAQPWEGSWVAMTFDERGRVIVSPQGGLVLRSVKPLFGLGALVAGEEVQLESLALPVASAQGLLCAHGSLYVNVVAAQDSGGGLHRLRDTDGDDLYDEDTVLRAHGHPSEHGTHAVVLGPDGMLYVIVGNHVPLPDVLASTSPHQGWAEDLLLPRLWDPRGHAVNVKAPGGQVLRTDAAGTQWELVAAGMRNAYDLAFNAAGEMFTYDSDMEWDVGAPWYRAPRVLHLTSGAEFGWRSGTGKWQDDYPDMLPPIVDTDLASPTGVCFATGSSFSYPWRDSLLVCDWAYGRILAVFLKPRGASYSGEYQVFAQGKPLNVTDLEFGADGALYFITGGRGTQAGLYRVTGPGEDFVEFGSDLQDSAHVPPDPAQALRRRLEALHGSHDIAALELVWPHLDNPDRHVRYAARVAVEHRAVSAWRERAVVEDGADSRLEALLALARVGEPRDRQLVLMNLTSKPWADLPAGKRLASLRVAAVCYARGAGEAAALVEPMLEWLTPAYPSGRPELDRELLELLVYLDAPGVVTIALDRLESAAEQKEALSTALTLRLARSGWDDGLRRRYLEWLRASRDLPGGLSLQGFVLAMEKGWLEGMDERTRVELVGAPEPTASADSAQAPEPRPFVQAWTMRDLTLHLDEVGSGRDIARGREAFAAALCNQCHRMAGEGGAVAPDLTGAGSRFSRRDLLEAILEPSKVISDQYQQVLVSRADGTMVAGRLVADTPDRITVDTNPFGGASVEIPRADIADVTPSPVSLMPSGLVYTLSKEEILDLLAYIESGG